MANEDSITVNDKAVRTMERLCQKLPRVNRRIRILGKECCPVHKPRRRVSVKNAGSFFLVEGFHEGAMIKVAVKKTVTLGELRKALQVAWGQAAS